MNAVQMREARLADLRTYPRVMDGGPIADINGIGGLIELIKFAKPESVIEIGSHCGISTEAFLLHDIPVTSVDPWPHEEPFAACMSRCTRYPGFKPVRGYSPGALAQFADNEFDMAYIDGEHDYKSVLADIRACRRIARRWVSGHDFFMPLVRVAVLCEFGRPDEVFGDGSWLNRLADKRL